MPFFDLKPTHVCTAVYPQDIIAEEAFKHFRASGFQYPSLPLHLCMQEINDLAKSDDSTLLKTTTAYRVADTYHPHRFLASAMKMKSPVAAFNNDVDLRKAIRLHLESVGKMGPGYPSTLTIVNGTQACSNFRPGFALFLYRKYTQPGDTVLDTSTGYGGRLVGFLASRCHRYIGYDPNTLTHAGNSKLASDLSAGKVIELRNVPIEDADADEFAEQCDFSFTSPPYFCKEIYSDEPTQSCHRYKTGPDWCRGFLVPMMRHQFTCLKPGATSIVNIADVKIKGTGMLYPLVSWTKRAASIAGFSFVGERSFVMSYRMGSNEEAVAKEPVLIFRKPQ